MDSHATADWAIFDAMANTVLMGDDVTVSRGKTWRKAQGSGDLTTGMYRFEIASGPTSQLQRDHALVSSGRGRYTRG